MGRFTDERTRYEGSRHVRSRYERSRYGGGGLESEA